MKSILVINDISGLGNCSMAANLPIFTKMGYYCMPLPTAVFNCQTGFDGFKVMPNRSVADFADGMTSRRKPDSVYVGFCNDTRTLAEVATVLTSVNCADSSKIVDPVMGDNGKLYPVFDSDYVDEMKRVVRLADYITPNVTEACLLAGIDYAALAANIGRESFADTCLAAFTDFTNLVGCKNAVITGVDCGIRIVNIVLEQGKQPVVMGNGRVDGVFSGTGDVFSSVLTGSVLAGLPLDIATYKAAEFVKTALWETQCDDRRFGVEFCRVIDRLD